MPMGRSTRKRRWKYRVPDFRTIFRLRWAFNYRYAISRRSHGCHHREDRRRYGYPGFQPTPGPGPNLNFDVKVVDLRHATERRLEQDTCTAATITGMKNIDEEDDEYLDDEDFEDEEEE